MWEYGLLRSIVVSSLFGLGFFGWLGCKQRVSPFYRTFQFADSEEFDFRVWFSWGFSDAIEDNTAGVFSLHRATKFIIGFDFAVTLASLESFCALSTSVQKTLQNFNG